MRVFVREPALGLTAFVLIGLMAMFIIYPQGNPLQASEDSPYLQIGETKYGRPILDRSVAGGGARAHRGAATARTARGRGQGVSRVRAGLGLESR